MKTLHRICTFARLFVVLPTLPLVAQTSAQRAGVFNPSWAPDGQLLFESNEGGRYGLWVVRLDGSPPRRYLSVDFEHQQPVVSPDGKRIAFVANIAGGDNEIFIANVDGTGKENISNAPGSQYLPRWSPDSRRVAYISSVPNVNTRDIVVYDLTTKTVVNVTNSPDRSESNIGWAPGTSIAFTVNEGNETNVYVMNPDGTNARQVTRGLQAGGPAWSPSGEIVFSSRHEGQPALYLMKGDGTNLRRLNQTVTPVSNPVWAPDGKRLAVISSANGKSSLFVMSADGTNVTCAAGACLDKAP
jgi:TolB protein